MHFFWNIEDTTGYKPQTTFWTDFSVAEVFGDDAVRDTFCRAFEEWNSNYIYLTELVLVLNWKLWEHHEEGNETYAALYNELWEQADLYACENLTGDELSYFYATTD